MAERVDTSFNVNTPEGLLKDNERGCTERIKRLRRISHSTQPHLDLERAVIETDWREPLLRPKFIRSTRAQFPFRF